MAEFGPANYPPMPRAPEQLGPPKTWHGGRQIVNPNAWGLAFGISSAVAILAAAVCIPLSSRDPFYLAGMASMVPIVAGTAIGFFAYRSQTHWRWWAYPLTVVPLSLVMAAPMFVVVAEDRAADLSDAPAMEFVTPETFGELAVVEMPGVETQLRQYRNILENAFPGSVKDLTLVHYGPPGFSTLTFIGTTFHLDSEMDEAMLEDPDNAVLNYLAGAGVTDTQRMSSSDLSGAIRCGILSSHGMKVCAWTNRGILGRLTFGDQMTMEQAADLTREFRALAEHPR